MFEQRMRGYGRSRLELPLFVVDQILASDYAKLVARKRSVRRALLPQIVSLHTKRDLGAIKGLGPVSIRKIEVWLARLDTRLRNPNESIDTAICRFRPRSLSRFGSQAPFVSTNQAKWRRAPHADHVDAGTGEQTRLQASRGDICQPRAGSPTMSGCRASDTAGETQITSACAAKIAAAR